MHCRAYELALRRLLPDKTLALSEWHGTSVKLVLLACSISTILDTFASTNDHYRETLQRI